MLSTPLQAFLLQIPAWLNDKRPSEVSGITQFCCYLLLFYQKRSDKTQRLALKPLNFSFSLTLFGNLSSVHRATAPVPMCTHTHTPSKPLLREDGWWMPYVVLQKHPLMTTPLSYILHHYHTCYQYLLNICCNDTHTCLYIDLDIYRYLDLYIYTHTHISIYIYI